MGHRAHPRRGRAAIALAIAAVASLSLVPHADALKRKAGKLKTVAAVSAPAAAAGQEVKAKARCPKGTSPVGVGWSAPFGDTGGLVVVYAAHGSHANDEPTAVVYGVAVGAGSIGKSVTAYAYCRHLPGFAKISIEDQGAMTPPTLYGTASATGTCPAGRKVIGPRFGHRGTNVFSLFQSRKQANGWNIAAYNVDGTDSFFYGGGYCMKTVWSSIAVATATSGSITGEGQGSISTVSPACPGGTRPSAGGFTATPLPQGFGFLPVITENHIAGRSWLVTAVNDSGADSPVPVNLAAEVMCTSHPQNLVKRKK